MFFTCEITGKFVLRLPVYDGILYCYPEIPFSKFFGYIGDHIHETIREVEENEDYHDTTSCDLFRKYPINYMFIYKNNNNEQNKMECINDYQPIGGNGQGPKVELNHRSFNKQILILFEFDKIDSHEFIKCFFDVWLNRSTLLKSLYPHNVPKKDIIKNISDIPFELDDENVYYTYTFDKHEQNYETNNTMLYMYNRYDKTKSNFIKIKDKEYLNSYDLNQFVRSINDLTFSKTSDIL